MIFSSLNWLLGTGLNLFPQLSERASIHKLTAVYSGKEFFPPRHWPFFIAMDWTVSLEIQVWTPNVLAFGDVAFRR